LTSPARPAAARLDRAVAPTLPISPDRHTLSTAALANLDIQSYVADPKLGRIWTKDAVRRTPPCRNDWEHVTVIATTGEAKSAAKHKNWGQFFGVFPLAPDDPVHPYRILYVYKATSPYNRRVEQRKTLKRILGKKHRPLVTKASRSTKRDFLRTLPAADTRVIRFRLGLEPGHFWRVAKGNEFINRPAPARQLILFDDQP
jgi:hypothetical protein